MILVDTNVLVTLANPGDPNHATARIALRALVRAKTPLAVAAQNVAELWVVLTRPATSPRGMGWAFSQARRYREWLLERCTVLPESDIAFANWKRLVDAHQLAGVGAHDCRLVAVSTSLRRARSAA